MARLLHKLAGTNPGRPMPDIDRRYLDRLVRAGEGAGGWRERQAVPTGALVDPLTDREYEVLCLVAQGKRNQEIADELVVTVDTVKKHLSHVLDKLAVSNRTEAVAEARSLGLLGDASDDARRTVQYADV